MSEESETDEQFKNRVENNFKAMQKQIKQVKKEMRNSKPEENIRIRKVEATDDNNVDTDQIVVEHSVQRWFSVNYLKKMVQDDEDDFGSDIDLDLDEEDEEDEEDTLL